jgi:WD40 repeat protein
MKILTPSYVCRLFVFAVFGAFLGTVLATNEPTEAQQRQSAPRENDSRVVDKDQGTVHIDLPAHAAFSGDGKRVVVAKGEQVIVRDVESGKEVFTHKGRTGYDIPKSVSPTDIDVVVCVAFSPDGKRIASGQTSAQFEHTVKLWDAETGQKLLTLKGHTGRVWTVAFSLDGKRIVSGAEDKTLKIWDIETGQEIRTLKGHAGAVTTVAFSGDGKRIVSGSLDKTLKFWEAETGQLLRSLPTGVLSAMALSPEGKWLVTCGSAMLKMLDAETGQEVRTLRGHTGLVQTVAFSPDGRRVISGADDKTVKIWDIETGQEIRTLRGLLPSPLKATHFKGLVRHTIVHNKYVVEQFRRKGAIFSLLGRAQFTPGIGRPAHAPAYKWGRQSGFGQLSVSLSHRSRSRTAWATWKPSSSGMWTSSSSSGPGTKAHGATDRRISGR